MKLRREKGEEGRVALPPFQSSADDEYVLLQRESRPFSLLPSPFSKR
jgi:hypothetical protein